MSRLYQGRTVVEHLAHNPNIKGSDPIGIEIETERKTVIQLLLCHTFSYERNFLCNVDPSMQVV